MADVTFYTSPMSRGRIARWMLEETGCAYDAVLIAFDAPRPPALLAANPMGKVPTIVHGDAVVSEAAATLRLSGRGVSRCRAGAARR